MSKSMSEFGHALERLESWFERQKRILPWRSDPSVYRVWISEIMLQQTQVVTVIPFFERFVLRFPTVEILAKASEEEVLLHWAGLGYYSRARNLHRAARLIILQGFPTDLAGWLEMPGVGAYTAGAILSISSNLPMPILDGNVERVLSRVRAVGRERGDTVFKERLWRLSRISVQRAHRQGIPPSHHNQALMELGATICTPRKPRCELCPLNDICRARELNQQETYPPRKKPKQWVRISEETHCIFDEHGRVLVRQQKKGEWRAGLWDLPSELDDHRVRLGLSKVGQVETRHVVTRHKITRLTHVWQVRVQAARRAGTSPAMRAADPSEIVPSPAPARISESAPAQVFERWIDARAPEVAVGSALKRVLRSVSERFPEVWPEN